MANTKKLVSDCRVELGVDLVMAGAGELHVQLGEALVQAVPVVLDAAAVARVDTAGLQLLHAFVQSRKQQGMGPWRWENVGAELRAAAAQLGLERMLELPDATPATH